MKNPYAEGARAALEEFGVRTAAANAVERGMPHYDMPTGAEFLAKRLSGEREFFENARPAGRLGHQEKSVLWGAKQPMEAGSMATDAASGIGLYGGV